MFPGSDKELATQIEALGDWFHNINLNGIQTAPNHFLGDYPGVKFKSFEAALPKDLTGKTVLDIGCNAGFYSIEMKKRGAARVVGIDSDERYLAQARLAASVFNYNIEFQKKSVYEVASLGERFDVVIFMGVLYHLRHPLLALDLLYEHAAADLLIFQSMQRGTATIDELEKNYPFEETDIFESPGFPQLYFVEHSYSNDPTNWWIPNQACMEAMLRSAGFAIKEHPEKEVYICKKTELPENRTHTIFHSSH